jgi:cellulose synthase/poly-beta-1,6-N-acetylglucosamine synthase-like glycosyltransferase
MIVLDVLFASLAGLALLHAAVWTLLSLLAFKRPRTVRPTVRPWRLAVIVPAHNEEAGIARTVASLKADTFEPAPRVLVVADNCTDGTAAVAATTGAGVLVREDQSHRGKSFALAYAVAHLQAAEDWDACVVVDADTTVLPGFFSALAASLDEGAAVVQGRYAVNPGGSALARLRALAFVLVHFSRPLGAVRMGLGCGLKGNGMAFRRDVIADGIPGRGIAEDAAATLAFASQGIGVHYQPLAVLHGEMAGAYREATVQDRRWEGGRLALAPRAAFTALRCLSARRWRAAGSALDVAALPLTLMGACATVAIIGAYFGIGWMPLAVAAVVSLALYPGLGWTAARVAPRELSALVQAPVFALHKLRVLLSLAVRGAPQAWERTTREPRP